LGDFSLYASVSSVEILPPGIHKGAGLEWLARELDIPLALFGGIGDAPSDLTFLSRAGYSAAPANATADVQAGVQYTSPFDDARGVRDILEKWLAH
jgi:hydroxymethylpyrimidine pyrophosphatase-like HAD family hydrolase